MLLLVVLCHMMSATPLWSKSPTPTAIDEIIMPRGVAVMLEAEHTCMSMRGVSKPGSTTITTQFTGQFDDPQEQARFIAMVRAPGR